MRALSAVASLSLIATFSGAVVAACTLNTEGLHANEEPVGPDASTSSDASTTPDASTGLDASNDAEPPPDGPLAICDGNPADCTDPVPMGWQRVGYANNRDTGCAEGFTMLDVTADLTVPPGACTCDKCMITQPPDCSADKIFTHIDHSGGQAKCDQPGATLENKDPNGCNDVAAILPDHASASPPAPQGGQCLLGATPHKDKLSSTSARVCVPNDAACEAELCAKQEGYIECIWADGVQTCPAGPFMTRHVTGTNPDFTCSDCGCNITGAACGGSIMFYSSEDCSGQPALTLAVDDACVETNEGTSLKSFTFKPTPAAMCAVNGTSNPTPTLEGPKTVCCK